MRYVGSTAVKKPKVWQEAAVCATAPEDDQQAFTGPTTSRVIAQDINARYCSHCPVKRECANWAQEDVPFTGIAGGYVFTAEKNARYGRRVMRIPPSKE